MDDETGIHAALRAMIPQVEGKPVVLVTGNGEGVFLCRRIHALEIVPNEGTFLGECEWVDPPEARPDELTDGMAISSEDLLQMGPGWWYDAYFDWYFVYEPAWVAQSFDGDRSWIPAFLAAFPGSKA